MKGSYSASGITAPLRGPHPALRATFSHASAWEKGKRGEGALNSAPMGFRGDDNQEMEARLPLSPSPEPRIAQQSGVLDDRIGRRHHVRVDAVEIADEIDEERALPERLLAHRFAA